MANKFRQINYWSSLCVRIDVFNSLISTYQNRLTAWLNGIELGANSRFYGKAIFKKSRESRIVIGRSCTFRSNPHSNLIGINRPCIFSAHGGGVLTVGELCGFSGTVIGCFKKITLGTNVRCGANTLITDSDWHIDDPRSSEPKEIVLEDNVWLGVNVLVLKGVTIGKNSVVGAYSVVTKDIPDNVVAAGNPCRVLRRLV